MVTSFVFYCFACGMHLCVHYGSFLWTSNEGIRCYIKLDIALCFASGFPLTFDQWGSPKRASDISFYLILFEFMRQFDSLNNKNNI
jgi:hypothetical protein